MLDGRDALAEHSLFLIEVAEIFSLIPPVSKKTILQSSYSSIRKHPHLLGVLAQCALERNGAPDRGDGDAFGRGQDPTEGEPVRDRHLGFEVSKQALVASLVGETGTKLDTAGTELEPVGAPSRQNDSIGRTPVAGSGELHPTDTHVDFGHPVASGPVAGGGVPVATDGERGAVGHLAGEGEVHFAAVIAEGIGENLVGVAGRPQIHRHRVGDLPVDAGLNNRFVRDFHSEPRKDVGRGDGEITGDLAGRGAGGAQDDGGDDGQKGDTRVGAGH